MGWYSLEDLADAQPSARDLERARLVQAGAAKMLRMFQQGKWDPGKTLYMSERMAQQLDGLEDELGPAFSPQQRAALAKMAARLRAYARMVGRQHDHGPGTQLGRLRMERARARRRAGDKRQGDRLTAVPISGWERDSDDDPELGFLPALPAILGAAAPIIGGLFGGGDKKAAPAPAPAPAGPPIIVPGGGGGGGSPDVNLPAIGGVVADQIRAVPPPVRQQVVDAMREIMSQQRAGQMDVADMMKQIGQLLGPKLGEQLASVNKAALQRQATYEHESIKRNDQRWQNNAEAQRRILARLDEMEGKLGNAVVNEKKRKDAVARAFGIPPRYQG